MPFFSAGRVDFLNCLGQRVGATGGDRRGGRRHGAGLRVRGWHSFAVGRGELSAEFPALRGQPAPRRSGPLDGHAGHRERPGPGHSHLPVQARSEGGFNIMFVIVAVAAALVVGPLVWSQLQRRRRLARGR